MFVIEERNFPLDEEYGQREKVVRIAKIVSRMRQFLAISETSRSLAIRCLFPVFQGWINNMLDGIKNIRPTPTEVGYCRRKPEVPQPTSPMLHGPFCGLFHRSFSVGGRENTYCLPKTVKSDQLLAILTGYFHLRAIYNSPSAPTKKLFERVSDEK